MNIVFRVHLKVYKLKISTIILNLQMFQMLFILYTWQEILPTLPRFTGSQEKNTALLVARTQGIALLFRDFFSIHISHNKTIRYFFLMFRNSWNWYTKLFLGNCESLYPTVIVSLWLTPTAMLTRVVNLWRHNRELQEKYPFVDILGNKLSFSHNAVILSLSKQRIGSKNFFNKNCSVWYDIWECHTKSKS